MRLLRAIAALAATAFMTGAAGCVSSTVLLHVRANGSGRATITSRLYLSGMRSFDAMFAAQGTAPARPPQLEEELPAPGLPDLARVFGVPVKLISSRLDSAPDGGIRTTEVEFDDIRGVQMIFPPVFAGSGQGFGGFSGLDDAPLMTFAVRTHDNGDRLLTLKLPNPTVSNSPTDPITVFETNSPEEQLFKQAIKNLALKLFVEIEPPLLRTNAPKQEGNRATILDLDLDRMINAMDEPRVRRMMAMGSFQEMMWQAGDLPGAVVPVDREIFLEYEGPAQQPAAPPPQPATPPDTEIYLAPLTSANGTITLGDPINITNSPGYDNQPSFTPDGSSILFTSVRGSSPGTRDAAPATQTEIYRYDRRLRAIVRVTQTPESEYSPLTTPDGSRIAVVRVEAGGTQRLWTITPGGPKIQLDLLLPEMAPVGYHAWADDHTVALFILGANGAPATLQLVDTKTGEVREAATDIGRSLLRTPDAAGPYRISFVQRERDGDRVTLTVKEIDPSTRQIRTIGPAVAGSREADLAWMPDRTLLMVNDDILYARPAGQSNWKEVAQLQRLSLRGVTRIAVSPKGDAIALVASAAQAR